jgi:diketogulonate reductase-like aldo/keto reductase
MTSTAITARADSLGSRMQSIEIAGTSLVVSRIGLGTWAIGGWMWGGTDEAQSIRTIHEALDRGITLFDTAPVYGFGRSEEFSARPWRRTAAASVPSSPPRSALIGATAHPSAMAARSGS